MKNVFIKKYWEEDCIWFYLHFQDGKAVEQIEVTSKGKVFLSIDHPNKNGSMLYDQGIEELSLEEGDFITEEEFSKVWNEQ